MQNADCKVQKSKSKLNCNEKSFNTRVLQLDDY